MKQVITTYPNKGLFEKTRDIPIDQIKSETFSQIGSSMLQILKDKGGIGLSANQVGLPFNMCVISVDDVKILLNPRIVKMSDKMIKSKEGCLSLPGAVVTVSRHRDITVEYEDVTAKTQELKANGLLSCCLQHEIDHLKGILMINRIPEFHKSKALKQVHKFRKIRNGKFK
jgi:peptide deformylase